ncbi:MAG: hypothetical protein ACYTG5_21115 [Planctomycetota bacterium]|jgi:hypothetical protein
MSGERPDLIVAVSDLHAGSTCGLMPAGGVRLEGQALYSPGPESKQLWRYWLDLWKEVGDRKRELGADLAVILNGDLTDGVVFKNQELVNQDTGTQVDIALEVLNPMLELSPETIYVTRGTPSHVGMFAGLERAVARQIGAEQCPNTGHHTAYRWMLNAHGKRIFATHHPPSAGRLVRTRKSQAALNANEVASRFWERGLEPPDLAIFSHKHEPEDTGPVMPHRKGTRVILLGAWQGKTAYAEKVASVSMNQEHHAVALTVHPERQRAVGVEHFVYPIRAKMKEAMV